MADQAEAVTPPPGGDTPPSTAPAATGAGPEAPPRARILEALEALRGERVSAGVRQAAVEEIAGVLDALPDPEDLEPRVIDARHADTKLALRIAEAMINAAQVTKSRENREQGYKFASAEDMLKAVRGPLLERGIILIQHPRPDLTVEHQIRSSRGTEGTRIVLASDMEFMDGHSDQSLKIVGWTGEGQDYGDKAYGKARTNLLKTFIRAQWLLPVDDDTDPEATPPGEARAAAAGSELPVWARPAPVERKREFLELLTPIVGRENAQAIAQSLATAWGHFPDGIVGFTTALNKYYVALHGVQPDPAVAAVAREQQDRDAEQPDAPPPEEDLEIPPPGAGLPDDDDLAEAEIQRRIAAGEIAAPTAEEVEYFGGEITDGLDNLPPDEEDENALSLAQLAKQAAAAAAARPDLPFATELPAGTAPPASIEEPVEIAGTGDPARKIMLLREHGCVCPSPLQRDGRDPRCPINHIPF